MNLTNKLLASVLALGTVALGATPAKASCGEASYYGPGLYGNLTASGEVFRPGTMTAAHPYLPLGSWVRVRSMGKSVRVKITDRGPYVPGRIIDLSETAFSLLAPKSRGLVRVCIARS